MLAWLIVESGAALTTRALVSRGWMAEVPAFSASHIDEYFAHRDPALGWRPAFNSPAAPCVSAYGDSFTAGSGEASYPAELARILGCDVANYGVGGYGSDQAVMLADAQRRSGVDRSALAIVGHVSENILRNVNQYRNLLYPGQELFFKPRYVLEGNHLVVIPPPIQQPSDFQRLHDHPEQVLTADAFVSRPRRRFPYALSLLRWLVADFHVRATLQGIPRHQPFYASSHPSGAFSVTTALLIGFARQSGNRLVVLIPVGDDFFAAKRDGAWPDLPLALALQAARVPVVHAGPLMLKKLGDADPCALFSPCNGHYNARGYRLLAEVIAQQITTVAPPLPRARGIP